MKLNNDAKEAKLSLIFKWYHDDFESCGGPFKLIHKSMGKDLSGYEITYFPYNWALNDARAEESLRIEKQDLERQSIHEYDN